MPAGCGYIMEDAQAGLFVAAVDGEDALPMTLVHLVNGFRLACCRT